MFTRPAHVLLNSDRPDRRRWVSLRVLKSWGIVDICEVGLPGFNYRDTRLTKKWSNKGCIRVLWNGKRMVKRCGMNPLIKTGAEKKNESDKVMGTGVG